MPGLTLAWYGLIYPPKCTLYNRAMTAAAPRRVLSSQFTAIELAIAVIAIFVTVAPFAIPQIPVATDLPKHVLVGNVLAHFHDSRLAYLRDFALVYRPRATVLGELALAALIALLPPFVAVKVYLALVTATLWLSGRYLVVQMGSSPFAALLLLPLVQSSAVFTGLLPFIASVSLFPLLPAVLIRYPSGYQRALRVAPILVLLYGFHIVAAAMGCMLTVIFALEETSLFRRVAVRLRALAVAQEPRIPSRRIAAGLRWDLCSIVPAALLMLYFVLQKDSHATQVFYYPPLRQIAAYLAYNVGGLSRIASYFLLIWIALAVVIVWSSARHRGLNIPLLVFAVAAVVLGVCLPTQIGGWFLVGSRTLPFALIAVAGLPGLGPSGWRQVISVAMAILCLVSVLNTRAELRVQPMYQTFLSGVPHVAYGSRVLPVIEDRDQGGNALVEPFSGIEDAYNIFRGGSNPYVFAYPAIMTGASPIRMTWTSAFTNKFERRSYVNYRGVGNVYDYVVLWGNLPWARSQFDAELDPVFQNGPLVIYRSRTRHWAVPASQ